MDSRQFEVLVGISRKMEDSLSKIEKSLSGSEEASSKKTTNALGGVASSLNSIIAAVNSKKFDSKKANNVLEFSRGLVAVANSVNPTSAKAFAEFSQGLAKSFDTLLDVMSPVKMVKLYLASKILFEGKTPLLQRIVNGMMNAFKDLNATSAKEGAQAIKMLGDGLISLSKALKSFILIGIAAPLIAVGALVVRAVIGLFSTFGKNAKAIREGGEALKSLGKGLVAFSAGLATVLLITFVASPERILGAISILALFGLTFWALGKASDSISRGARSVALMGLAVFGFSAALATFMLVMMIVDPALIMMGIAVIAAFAVVFALLGIDKVAKQVAEGALLLIGMSFAIAFFGLGLIVFGAAIKMYSPENLLMGAAIITAIGLAMALVGSFKERVSLGAKAVSGMGMALIAFGLGVAIFGLAIKIFDFEDIALGAMLIATLGVAFGIVGLMKAEIKAGAIAVGEMGIALFAFSAGILVFGIAIKLLKMVFKDLGEAGLIAGGIIVGLGVAFSIVGLMASAITPGAEAMIAVGIALIAVSAGILVFALAIKALQSMFDNLKEAGTIAGGILIGFGLAFAAIGLLAIPIVFGAGALATMGVSLVLFSAGLMIFALATKGLMNIFGPDLGTVGEKMNSLLLSLGWAFSGLGVLSIPIVFGASALLTMGAALAVFGAGLLMYGHTLNYLSEKGLLIENTDGVTISGLSIVSKLAEEISNVGSYAGKLSFWGGIAASIGLGTSLMLIGNGLNAAAKALNEVKDMDKLISNLFGDDGLIHTMADQFAKIGNKYGAGLLSSFLGTDPVSMGVKSVRGFGDVLKQLAGGIVAFANFSEFPVEVPDPKNPSKLIYRTVNIFSEIIPALNENLPKLLSVLAGTFADIGNRFGGEGGWFGEDSPVQKGVSAIQGLGSVLSEIAGGIVAFSRFEEFPVQIPDPKDPSKLIYKSINLYETLPKIKTALVGDGNLQGKLTPKSGILLSLAEVFAEIGNKYGDSFFSDGPVKKGIDAVQGIGGVVSELAQGIIAFANMQRGLPNYDKDGKFTGTYTPFSLEAVKNNIISVLNVLPQVFAGVDVERMREAQEKARAALPLAESISKVAEAMQSLVVDKDGKKESIVALIGAGIKQIVLDTKDIQIDPQSIVMLNNLGKALRSFGSFEMLDEQKASGLKSIYSTLKDLAMLSDPLNKLAASLETVGKSFPSLSNGFVNFSTQFDKVGNSIREKFLDLQVRIEDLVSMRDPLDALSTSLKDVVGIVPSLSSGFSTEVSTISASVDTLEGKFKNFFTTIKDFALFGDSLKSSFVKVSEAFPILSSAFDNFSSIIEKKGAEINAKLGVFISAVSSNFAKFDEAGASMKNFSTSLSTMSSLGEKLLSTLETIGGAFASIGNGFSSFSNSLSAMTSSLSDFTKVFPLLSTEFTKFVTHLENVVDNDKVENLYSSLHKLSLLKDPLFTLASSLSSTGNAFMLLTAGFGKFALHLEKFSKFEKSFSALAQNSYNYKFDKFAASVGTLKKNVNDFNVENLKMTDSLMKSLAILSKSPDLLGDRLKEAIKEPMQQLVDVIKEISENSSSQTSILDKIATFNFNTPAAAPSIPQSPLKVAQPQASKNTQETNNQLLMSKIDRMASAVEALVNKLQTGDQGALKVIDVKS